MLPSDAAFHANQPPWPDWVSGFRDHQINATTDIIEAFDRGATIVIADAPTGCLAGETKVALNRCGKGFTTTLQDLYEKFHGRRDNGKRWEPDKPTFIAQGDTSRMVVGSREIKDVMLSGLKDTVIVHLNDGKSIRLTPCHQVMTEDGWVRAGNLTTDHSVVANIGRRDGSARQPKQHYPRRGGLKGHPRASMPGHPKAGWTVPTHILAVEAEMNGLTLDAYCTALRAGNSSFKFIDPKMHVHHIDENPHNYHLDNLQVLTAEEHHRHHGRFEHVAEQLGFIRVKRITQGGPTLTFDIEMADSSAPHFMADGIYVHNSGKTLLAEMVRRLSGAEQAIYVCNTIGLQDQVLEDFPYARLIKGANNFIPLDGPRDATCADCPGLKTCKWCIGPTSELPDCPYRAARESALGAQLAVANTSYFLRSANYANQFTGRDLIIADESDTLENILTDLIEFRVPWHWLVRCGLDTDYPRKGTHLTTAQKWTATSLIPALKAVDFSDLEPIDARRQVKDRDQLLVQAKRFATTDSTLWVRDNDTGPAVWKPIICAPWGEEMLWAHGKKWLLMSGSVVSATEQITTLGAEDRQFEVVNVPMTFPVENRPIVVAGVANMSAKTLDDDIAKMVDAIRAILDREAEPDDRVLVHCVSYKLAERLAMLVADAADEDSTPRDILTYRNAGERDAVFEEYAKSRGGVLFAASMDRGFDFKGDLARHVIIAKVPFPYLGDSRVAARMRLDDGNAWYSVQTVRTVLQMTGRGVRSADDHCTTWILDSQFSNNLFARSARLFPQWWRDAVNRRFQMRRLMRRKAA